MPPKALIFSPDPALRSCMASALNDLELTPEPCADIFFALEALTSRDFEVIVADWSEGAEASFLLKTAGELKSRMPFCIAIINPEQSAVSGPDLALKKPLTRDGMKRELLSHDGFLARMKNWLQIPEETEYTGLPVELKDSVRDTILRTHPISSPEALAASLTSTYEHASRQIHAVRRAKSTKTRDLCILGVAAIAAFSFAIYHFRQPLVRNQLELAVTSSDAMGEVVNEAVLDDTNYLLGNDPNVTVTPIHRKKSSRGRLQPASTRDTIEISNDPNEDVSDDANDDASVMTPNNSSALASLPDSLHYPVPPQRIPNSTLAGAPPAVFGTLQPVELSEDSAEMLLLKKVSPQYPEQALKMGVEGPVVFQASIARDGSVQELKLLRGPMALVQAAYYAAKQWRFKPYAPNGEATEARITMTVDFQRTQLAMSK